MVGKKRLAKNLMQCVPADRKKRGRQKNSGKKKNQIIGRTRFPVNVLRSYRENFGLKERRRTI